MTLKSENYWPIMFIMEGTTISEMATRLGLTRDNVRKRLNIAGRKPFSQEALYTEEDFNAIKDVPPPGRPPKKQTADK